MYSISGIEMVMWRVTHQGTEFTVSMDNQFRTISVLEGTTDNRSDNRQSE